MTVTLLVTVFGAQPSRAADSTLEFGKQCNKLIIHRKYKEAMQMANQELARNPNSASAYTRRGWIFAIYEEPQKAMKEWDQALKLQPAGSFELFSNRYRIYLQLGKFDLAIKDLSAAIKLQPASWDLYKDRGQVHSVLKQYDLAIEDITKSISLNPAEPLCYQRRADCYRAAGQFAKAVADYTAAIKLRPQELLYYNLRADCYEKLGKHTEAMADRHKVEQTMHDTGF